MQFCESASSILYRYENMLYICKQATASNGKNYNNKQNKKLHSSGIILMICGGKLCVFFMRFIPVFSNSNYLFFFCIQNNKNNNIKQGEKYNKMRIFV